MKKKSLLTILSLMIVTGLAACGQKPSSSDSTKPSDESSSVESSIPAEEPSSSEEKPGSSSEAPKSSSSEKSSSQKSSSEKSSSEKSSSSTPTPGSSSSQEDPHHAANDWTYDKGMHWHKCADPSCDEKYGFAEHVLTKDANKSSDATCQAKGKLVEKCACGYERTTILPIADHTWAQDPNNASTPATCTENGVKHEKCTVCQDTRDVTLTKLGHTWIADPTDDRNVEVTHGTDGKRVDKCACGAEQVVTVTKLGHTWEFDSTDERNAPADHEHAGTKVEKCACGAENVTTIAIIPHTWVDDDEDERNAAPTHNETGTQVKKCAGCDAEDLTTVATIPHVWVEDAADEANRAATHLLPGIKVEKCACGARQEVELATVPHTWVLDTTATDLTNTDGKQVKKYSCSCGAHSYTVDVYDWSFLSTGSNAYGVDGYTAGTDAGNANGIRIAGNGNAVWKLPAYHAGKVSIAIGANPAPTSIGTTKIESKNSVYINDAQQTLIPQGAYNTLPITVGQFDELEMCQYTVDEGLVGTDLSFKITQKSSSRMYWGGVVRLTEMFAVAE